MIVPTKFTRFADTALSTAVQILSRLDEDVPVLSLYREMEPTVKDLDRFLLALDILYILGRIELDLERKLIRRAG
ncbi:MAG: hypothetical protein IPK74_00070 [Deltaproteobacteria bacterium]|nr:hypothetical protein [Deltaproteobacteria bacterium]